MLCCVRGGGRTREEAEEEKAGGKHHPIAQVTWCSKWDEMEKQLQRTEQKRSVLSSTWRNANALDLEVLNSQIQKSQFIHGLRRKCTEYCRKCCHSLNKILNDIANECKTGLCCWCPPSALR
eukprot:s1727_g6.t1